MWSSSDLQVLAASQVSLVWIQNFVKLWPQKFFLTHTPVALNQEQSLLHLNQSVEFSRI